MFSAECLIAAEETELRHMANKVLSNQGESLLNNTYFEVQNTWMNYLILTELQMGEVAMTS